MRPLLLLVLLYCFPAPDVAQTVFQKMTATQTGIQFSNDITESETLNVLAYEYFYNGGGVACGDINNDGLIDLYFTANMKPNRLYLNKGNLQFEDITIAASGELSGRNGGWKTGVTMADVNGDGLLDIYVCYSGKVEDDQRRNQLFINQGNLHFKESAKAFGLDDKSFSTQAAFFDYDNDGDLDMFLLNHSTKKIDNMEFTRYRNDVDEMAGNKLYENRNNQFFDVSKQAGIRQNPLTYGLGIAVSDVNKDGWQDVYVTNDYNEPDYLYINNKNGSFRDVSGQAFRHLAQFSMGVDIADFNNDGLPDIMTLDMLPEDNRRQKLLQLQENYEAFQLMINQQLHKQYMRNMLQLNNGDGTFSEIAQFSGIAKTDWSWCPLFADFDNDGFKDLFITNGYLRDYTNKDFLRYWGDYKVKKAIDREPAKMMDLVTAMPSTSLYNYIYRNNGSLGFSNMKEAWGMTEMGISSGAVYADLDNDGDLEIIINHINKPASVYKNQARENQQGNFIDLLLKSNDRNLNVVGAKLYVYTKSGMQYQEVNPNRGYLSCVTTVSHFGLGKETVVDSLVIIWPDNSKQSFRSVAANQKLAITFQKSGQHYPSLQQTKPLFTKAANLIDHKDEANDQIDFKRQLLMLFMYSKTTPTIAKADVNKDGLEDIFISSDKTKASAIYLQNKSGVFQLSSSIGSDAQIGGYISAAAFFDANADGYVDLYLAKGGYPFYDSSALLQDELWWNDGKGKFFKSNGALPSLDGSSKSCVRPCDIDNDGDIDIFVGGRILPGQYPQSPRSYLLINNGEGSFKTVNASFDHIGMVTDAQWLDADKDGRKDLVLCGEFMPVTLLLNTVTGFVDKTKEYFGSALSGLWFSLAVADVDGDGNEDFIAGNIGQNSMLHFNDKEPAELFYADFDNNGSIDPFFNMYVQGTSYPFVSRDELNDQVYPMRRKFTSYKDYCNAVMENIVGREAMAKAGKLTAIECRSSLFLFRNGKFTYTALPAQAQFSAVTRILTDDYNKDGKKDLLLFGNKSDNRLKIGAIDGGYGCLLTGDGTGKFRYVDQPVSGLSVKGDVKSVEAIKVDDKKFLLIGSSGELLQWYKQD